MDRRTRSNSTSSRVTSRSGEDVTASGILDRFSNVDTLTEQTNLILCEMLGTLQGVQETQAQMLEQIGSDKYGSTGRSDIPLASDAIVPPDDSVTDEVEVPRDGTLDRVIFTFPSGTQQAVGIGLEGVDGENLVPYGPAGVNHISLDGETISFDLNYNVAKGETLTVNYVNNREGSEDDLDLYSYPSAILNVGVEQ